MQQSIKNEQEPQLTLLEQAEVYLKESGCNYSYVEGRKAIRCPLHVKNGNWTAFLLMNPLETVLVIHLYLPYVIVDNKKLKVADLLNRINCTLVLGKMSLRNEGGEISLVMQHLCLSKSISIEETELLITVACNSVDKFLVPITMVAFGDIEPALAMADYKA